jgi:hypothetical protein
MNDIIFNSYLVGEERELAIEESAMDVFFANLEMKYEMVNMQLEYDRKAAEFKVFSEGGTYDDFLYLLEEANEEAKEEKKGIIRTIIDAIKKIINKIGEKLASIGKNPGDPNEDVEIDEGVDKSQKALDSVASDINGVIDSLNAAQSGDIATAATSALNVVSNKGKIATVLSASGIAVATGVMIKIKRGKAVKDAERNQSLLSKLKNLISKHEKDDDNNGGGFIDTLKQVFTAIKDTVIKVINFISNGLSSIWHGAANKMFGKWKEVPEGTKGAKKCVTNDVEPGKDEVQMGEINKNLADGQSEAVEGHWYIKETEGGTKAREGKEEKVEQAKWKKAEGNDNNSNEKIKVIANNLEPQNDKEKRLEDAEKLVPGIKVGEYIINTNESKKVAGFSITITAEDLARVAGLDVKKYAKKTKNDDDRSLFEKLRNEHLKADQCNRVADYIWGKINDDRHAKTPRWGLDDTTWNSIPQDVQNVITGRVNNAGKSQNSNNQNNTPKQTNNTNNQTQQNNSGNTNNSNNNNSNGNEQNTNESVVDELLINPFVDYVRESDEYNIEISEIVDMLASL